MFSMKKIALSLALVGAAASASAMTAVSDEELSNTVGQDGVSIAANLNVNVGSFVYTDTDANGGSISFNNILTTGLVGVTIDIIDQATFEGILQAAGVLGTTSAPAPLAGTAAQQAALAAYYAGGDVVQIAFPNVGLASPAALLSQSVASITMGGNTASMGSIAMNQIDLRGTQVWIWAH